MTKYQETGRVEQITWTDHSANHDREEYTKAQIARRLREDVVNRTVGFVVQEDEKRVTLAHEARVDADMVEARFSHYTTIYKNGIVDRTLLDAPLKEAT